jgi:DNA-directed RNA polymerase specialized sigma24 family protein
MAETKRRSSKNPTDWIDKVERVDGKLSIVSRTSAEYGHTNYFLMESGKELGRPRPDSLEKANAAFDARLRWYKRQMGDLSKAQVREVLKLRTVNYSWGEIAKLINVDKGTISRMMKEVRLKEQKKAGLL